MKTDEEIEDGLGIGQFEGLTDEEISELKNIETEDDFLKPACQVKKGNESFTLSKQEIKHVRRCLTFYTRLHDRTYTHEHGMYNLSHNIYGKFFKMFGKMKRRLNGVEKKAKIKDMDRVCSFEGCQEKESLTLHHIKDLASGGNRNKKDNLKLICPKHHLLTELKHHLWQKGLEIEKLKKRIEDIEKVGTTDCLGYKVLSQNKFEDLDD